MVKSAVEEKETAWKEVLGFKKRKKKRNRKVYKEEGKKIKAFRLERVCV